MSRQSLTPAPTTDPDKLAIDRLLASDEPGIRLQAARDLGDGAAAAGAEQALNGAKIRSLLSGQLPDDGFGRHPYSKWTGAHWRLVSLVELGLPPGEPRAVAAAETVLHWLTGRSHRSRVPVVEGRVRRCASQEGNALAVCCRLGLARDTRVKLLADSLVEWQWPDGGWNCDARREAHHSSFNETVTPLWGLAEYARATGDRDAASAAHRTCELLLEHGVFKSHRTGRVASSHWLKLRYPAYWHYDFVQGLTMLARAGALPDERAADALALLRDKQQPDGLWHYEGAPFWRPVGRALTEVVDWGRSGPSEMLTLNALRILRAAGALKITPH